MTIDDLRKQYKTLSEEFKISVVSRVCSFCLHFNDKNPIERRCEAFPEGIPLEIWRGENDHTKPFPNDNGIRFEHFKNK